MMYYGYGIDSESIRTEELAIGFDSATVAEIKALIDHLDLPLKLRCLPHTPSTSSTR